VANVNLKNNRIAARFIPPGVNEQRHDDINAVINVLEPGGDICALAYVGRALELSFLYRFHTEETRTEYITK
jgi:hypothetical protein